MTPAPYLTSVYRTNIHQVCEDIECCLDDLLSAIADRYEWERERERERERESKGNPCC